MNTIPSIQVLRAVAIISVAISHFGLSYSDPQLYPSLTKGAAGVDLFFVVSGFIMVYSSETLHGAPRAALEFMTRRIIRVVPLYWLITTLYLVLAVAVPGADKDHSPWFTIASYLFIPSRRTDASLQPLVGQGWTLNYEMLFYAIFATTVAAERFLATIGAGLMVIALVLLGIFMQPSHVVLEFWTSPIILEFVFGMLIGLAYLEGVRLPEWAGWFVMSAGVLAFLWSDISVPGQYVFGRTWAWGLPAAAIVAGAALGRYQATGPAWHYLTLVGEASFAMYLTHPLVIKLMMSLSHRALPNLRFWPGLALALVLCAVTGMAIFYGIEKPLTRALRSAISRKPAALISA